MSELSKVYFKDLKRFHKLNSEGPKYPSTYMKGGRPPMSPLYEYMSPLWVHVPSWFQVEPEV
jgi:hypothetical protein